MAVDLSGWEALIENIAKQMHEGKLKPGELTVDFIRETYNELNESAGKGYGEGWGGSKTQPPSRAAILMQRNIYRFSGAKNHAMLRELNSKLTKDGQLVPWEEFKNEALKINGNYNLNYLQAEFQTANHSGRMAANWEAYQRAKKRFPALQYKTQNDDRVRDTHKALNNIVALLESEFWKKFYPPNGWRCRCYTVQTAADESENIPKEVPDVKPEFENNVGLTQEIFNETGKKPHPFFSMAARDSKGNSNLEKAFEISKAAAPVTVTHRTDKGAKVSVNPFADLKDLEDNHKAAISIAEDLNMDVTIRAHLDGRIVLNRPNPEFEIDGKLADRKAPAGLKLRNILAKANKQGCEIVVIDLVHSTTNREKALEQLAISLRIDSNYQNIKEIIVIDGSGRATHYQREFFKKKKAPK